MSHGGLVPDPALMSWEEWQSAMLLTFPEDELLPPVPMPDWRYWATSLYTRPSFSDAELPDPWLYLGDSDWRLWAARLREGSA